MKGVILNNRYEIKDIIGTGGMAIVYDGYDHVLSRNVAIKILKDSYIENKEFINKLKDEAKAAASISDDNIVSIYDVSTAVINGKNYEYIVMEKIEGRTLKEIIVDEAPLDNDRVINYAFQIGKALQTAHKLGLVHRDIKSANILINSDDKVKVVDFGIARVTTEATMTYTSSILGTVNYISPEQAKGHIIDERSDLYSLGIVMYEMLTGTVPFDGDSPVSVAVKHIQEIPKDIKYVNPNVGEELNYIVKRLLEKNPNDRYENATDLIKDLSKIKYGLGIVDKVDTNIKDDIKNQTIKHQSIYSKKNPEKDTEIISVKKEKKNKTLIIFISLLVIIGLIYGLIAVSEYMMGQIEEKNYIVMPNVVDINEDVAINKLKEYGLIGVVDKRVYNDTTVKGNIISQSVEPKIEIKKGSIIKFVVSKGKELVEVPNFVGYSINEIHKKLEDSSLVIGKKEAIFSESPKGKIISQVPKKGEFISKGSLVDIVISKGEEKIKVPEISDYNDNVKSKLENIGLKLGNVEYKYSELKEGKVIRQEPNVDEAVERNTKINFVVSKGLENNKVKVPNIQGLSLVNAISILKDNDFVIEDDDITRQYSSSIDKDIVIKQSLKPGIEVDKGSSISLIISLGEKKETKKSDKDKKHKNKDSNSNVENTENDENDSNDN